MLSAKRQDLKSWLLKVELNGEWEECRFATRTEALDTFAALTADYPARIQRAILLALEPKALRAGEPAVN
ncbi:MAG: hypothetical protein JOY54_11825 [Acidobacteriaceae bacterium]|nr:hypothetical protein [Acidobacteriaceae bacterium]